MSSCGWLLGWTVLLDLVESKIEYIELYRTSLYYLLHQFIRGIDTLAMTTTMMTRIKEAKVGIHLERDWDGSSSCGIHLQSLVMLYAEVNWFLGNVQVSSPVL